MTTMPPPMPIIIHDEEEEKCPKCGKPEERKEVCSHCGYEYEEEDCSSWDSISVLLIILFCIWFVITLIVWLVQSSGVPADSMERVTLLNILKAQWGFISKLRLW